MTADERGQPAGLPSAPALDGGQRALLIAFTALSAFAVLLLYVLSDSTDRLFAWTIEPPVTAAFVGAGYGAGVIGVGMGLRRDFRHIRIGLQAVLVFVVTTTVATLVHLDRFHLDATGIPRLAAWVWVAVYVAVPFWIVAVLWRSRDVPAARPDGSALSAPASAVLWLQGLLLCTVGVALFVAPASTQELWPWALTPLTARVVAAWLLAIGVAAVLATREPERSLLEVPAAIYASVAILQVGAMARFRDQVDWEGASAWVILGMLTVMAGTGAVGLAWSRRAS